MYHLVFLIAFLTNIIHAQENNHNEQGIALITLSSPESAIQNGDTYKNIAKLVTRETATTEALRAAVKHGRPDVVRLLLNHNAQPDQDVVLRCTHHCQNLSSKNRAEWWLLHQYLHHQKERAEWAKKPRWLQILKAVFYD